MKFVKQVVLGHKSLFFFYVSNKIIFQLFMAVLKTIINNIPHLHYCWSTLN